MGLLLLEVFPAFLGLTHTVTHTRKKADGVNGQESARDYTLPQQKVPNSGTPEVSNHLVRMRSRSNIVKDINQSILPTKR